MKDFLDPSNTVARILIGHFLAIELVVGPIVDREWSHRPRHTPIRAILNWIKSLYNECPIQLKAYLEWPVHICGCVEDELLGRKRAESTVSILRKNDGYSRTYF
jgi:hypothetical protein